jgi:hypothetical protein
MAKFLNLNIIKTQIMKKIRLLIALMCLVSSFSVNAQKLTPKQLEREKNKVEIYTSEERDNLQMAFYKHVKEMNLSEENEEEYYAVFLYYLMKMNRLNDKDKGLSEAQVKEQFQENIDKMNSEIVSLLNDEQKVMHQEYIDKFVYSVNTRLEKVNKKE